MRLRLILLSPLLLLLALFALSNREQVTLGLWPTGLAWSLPLCVAIFLAMVVAFACGAILAGFSAIATRRRARRAQARVASLQTELAALRLRLPP